MKTFSFTIDGNQEDRLGNAIPKIRKTYRQQWTPEAQRYTAWKVYIQNLFIRSLPDIDYRVHVRTLRVSKKPIKLEKDEKAVMDIRIFWKDETHGDPENIFGSIADALFQNDKYLDGSFKSELAKDGKGRVEIIITVN